MKKWFQILCIALLALSVPVSHAYANEEEPAKPTKPKEKKQATHPANEGAPKASETGGLGGQKVYVSIGPIILPIITDAGPQQIVTMIVSLQVSDTDASDKVREKLPRLVDAYMRALYGQFDSSNMHHGTIVNIDFIKQKISHATTEIMGDGVVEDVLIQAVAQRQV